ncbi:ATP-binding protein [Trueperella bialowiezensis]|uniref:AAA+ ATPase domain-containing protein n=1 Tax=Trueperella bialowiezensis TaxID=312285 RepID=A0A3S4YXL6_9ACTO|nr:DUF4143 domain-containing protein [Trueperella bialowiezensis]VEI13068.1 Uncharacterised protein [Trueperella bialowiezensis]
MQNPQEKETFKYLPRVADRALSEALQRAGAVLIEGPKGCGKTETARRVAASEVRVDTDPNVATVINLDPNLVLNGSTPRLLDEWQAYPVLWNTVRRAVDDRREKGQFILTGSTAPAESAGRHSGAGRFARITMQTMSLWETGHSSGEVSVAALLQGEPAAAEPSSLSVEELAERISRGGWPHYQSLTVSQALATNRDYIRTIAEVDIATPDGRTRNPIRVQALLRSLARGVGTEMAVTTIAADADLSRDTVRDYLDALARIYIAQDQPAWSLSMRSRTPLRKAPKRHLADPALALAALNKGPADLLQNFEYFGQLFESQVVHDLGVLSGEQVSHARLQNGLEVDAIIDHPDQRGLFEIKLGASMEVVNRAADNLKAFSAEMGGSNRLIVVTAGGYSYLRPDGVQVVSIGALGP